MCAVLMEEQELTTDEVAARLRVHPRTVLRLIAGHELRARKQGKRYRVRKSWLEEYLARTEIPPEEER